MVTEGQPAASFQRLVETEKIEVLFRNTSFTLVTNLLLSGGLVWVLWEVADPGALMGWWAAIIFLVGVRLVLLIGYRHRARQGAVPWHTYLTVATVLAGAAWGAAGILFFIPTSPIALIFVTIILAGITAGSVPAYSSWPPAQYASIPTALPLAIRYLVEGGDFAVMGLMCVLYLLNVLASARQVSRVLDQSIRLRLEKQELVQQLQEEKSAAEEARMRAEEANVAKSKFLAAASHDLRQPLHAVNLFVDALRHASDQKRADEVLAHLEASSQSLEELLNELLDISKLEAGLFKPEVCALDLQEILDGLERELRPVADEKGIELGFVATRLKVHSDALMLGRVLRNIITNAIRYTEQGAVLVGCRRMRGGVAIAVYDTGPGIPPEYHQAIFREFYQLGNPERDRRKGLGLGLAIVDGLCRILGHSLTLRSIPGRGSAFFVQVPIAPQKEVVPIIPREDCLADLQGCSILIIDDEPIICQAMDEVLGNWGCRVLTVESAREALALMDEKEFIPDAIVADYRLREGRTGNEAISEIRKAVDQQIPALIVTGDTAPERLREASASGYFLLHKPVQPARLRIALTRLLEAASGSRVSPGERQ